MNIDTSHFTCLVNLRAARAEDEEFLLQVYACTRAEEMAMVPWTNEQKAAFLRFQFEAQRRHYSTHYPAAQHWIILRKDVPIGRMIVNEGDEEILLMDIALLPEHRRQGIGTALIRAVIAEAADQHKDLILHVETFNPAMKLYERLGFVKTSEMGIYHEMIWHSGAEKETRSGDFIYEGEEEG